MGVYTEAVQKLYVAYFSRPADKAGLAYWEGIVTANGGNTAAVSTAFANSQEYKDTFTGQNQYQIINTIYMNLFGRVAEPAGLEYWGQGLIAGRFTIAQAVTDIAGAAQGTDATAYANKVKAAVAFTDAVDTNAEILGYTGVNANAAAKIWLGTVTTDASLTTAIVPTTLNSTIANVIATASSATGETFTLTNAIGEQVAGTTGNDIFSAVVANTATTEAGTFNTGDTVNGMGGQDTLNLLVTAGSAMPAGATVSNVEIINITHAGTSGPLALNSSTFAGVQQMWQIDNVAGDSFQDVTVGAGVTAGFRSNGTVAAEATVTAATGVAATAVALDSVATGSDITVAGGTALTTVSVSGSVSTVSSVNALTLATTAANMDVLNVSLSSNTSVTLEGFEAISTLNAAGSTGGLTVGLTDFTALTAATFGAGKDIVTINTGSLESGALAINLGAGNDVLNLSATAAADSTAISITMGAGNDTLALTALSNLTGTTAADITADMITVTDFVAAQDVLDLSGLNANRDVLLNGQLADINAATSLRAALVLAAAATDAGSYSVFNFGADAYVFNNVSDAALSIGDGLVKIVGFQVEGLTATNFVAGAAAAPVTP